MLALLIGGVAGFIGYLLGMPLPWMLGTMLGVTAAALMRLPIAGPDRLRPLVMPVIGVLLGSAFTHDTFSQLANWSATLLILPVALVGVASASYAVYRFIGRYDPTTAYYAAMPGGLNEMLMLGAEAGGNERKIALAHAARVLLVIFYVALFFGLVLGVRSGPNSGNWVGLTAITPVDYLVLGACAVAGVHLGRILHLPAGPVFGPMILSALAHMLGWVTVAPPTLIVIIAQIVVGTVIGSRFIGARLRDLGRDLGLAALATLLMLIVATFAAFMVARIVHMPLSQAFLAYAPGGLTEMALLTLSIQQDVAFVSVTHIVRITIVISLAPLIFRLLRKP